ncbi:MAG: DUF2190 family protein [Clostridium beijerinckii]|jgi:predicted RecA/RadA family phage recombinase|nr:DUF2190 family protein [Clostridium beijerinckii]MCI1578586.1 DUF2190 family protein [Clostridium beijerinckii]MCI1582082.1 DUF2190 family protein [Clostridium beijerinckii]MCI1621932.1 DUF2190 family protein [Clostridium beijerinckii]
MANFIQKGDIIDFPNATDKDIAYGQVVVLGNHVCVAAEDIKIGATGGLRTNGVFEFNAAKAPEIKVGSIVYYDTTNDLVTSDKGTLTTIAGFALSSKAANTDGTVMVKILDAVTISA